MLAQPKPFNEDQPKVYIKTFGCQMNEYDSSRILRLLSSYGYEEASSYETASVILLNTCSVRQKAEDKIYSELGRIKNIKKRRPDLILGIGGCVAQQEGINLIKRFPYVDLVFGTKTLAKLPHLLESVKNGRKTVDIDMNPQFDIYPLNSYSHNTTGLKAFITIMQGCNNYCSYCIVPYVRGPEWSRNPHEIKEEIKNLVDCGVKEITLLGQNVNSYGKTLKTKTTFPELLSELNLINGLERIRFTTSHPKDLSQELILSFKKLKKLCPHIHLPIQSGSNNILMKMNRCYTSGQYMEKIFLLKETVPDISITSDIIVGFPGETENDFMETVSIIEKICFDDLYIFHYTDRLGTSATNLTEKIPYKTKLERLMIINKLRDELSLKNNKKLVGEELDVLFESQSKKEMAMIAGRTGTNKVVNCKGPLDVIGKTASVKIEKANIHSLNGKLI